MLLWHILPLSRNCSSCDLDIGHIAVSIMFRLIVQPEVCVKYLRVIHSIVASVSVCQYSCFWFKSSSALIAGYIVLSLCCQHKDKSYYITLDDHCVFVPSGTRNAILNTEARTVEAEVLSRRCVIMRLADFSYEEYQKALRQSAGAVVIILPKNMSAVPQDIVQVVTLFSVRNQCLVLCPISPSSSSAVSNLIVCSSQMQLCRSAELCFVNELFSTSLYLRKRFLTDAFGVEVHLWHVKS